MITYVFPGQGSQQKGMGQGLFEQYQHFTDQADQILGYSIKNSVLKKAISMSIILNILSRLYTWSMHSVI